MKTSTFFFTLCFSTCFSYAQFGVLGADAFGRANTMVAVPGYSSLYQNAAGIGDATGSFLAFNYLKILPVEGFHTAGAQGVFTGKTFHYGFLADSFGDRYYRESRAAVALAHRRDRVSLGVKALYMSMHSPGMRTRNAVAGEVGMLARPSPAISLGINLVASPAWVEGSPVVLAVGAGVSPHPNIQISGQVDYGDHGSTLRLGLHYRVREQLAFSAGVDPALRSLHWGTQILAGRYGFFYSIATHAYAGIAHHTTFIYRLYE